MLIHLRRGGMEATLAPAIGGAIAALRVHGRDILRPASADALAAGDPLGMSEFPMAPYVNRVRGASFLWRGRRIDLAHAPGDRDALHAIAWRRPWDVVSRNDLAARLRLSAPAGPAWPFAFTATRTFSLEPGALKIAFEIACVGHDPMPAALGFHFYFPKPGAVIRVNAAGAWETDEAGIPQRPGMQQAARCVRDGAAAATLALDHCFFDWDGRARIDWPGLGVSIETSPAQRFVQIYAPAGGDIFCLEPQSAMPDALNRDPAEGGLRILAPGEAFMIETRLSAA